MSTLCRDCISTGEICATCFVLAGGSGTLIRTDDLAQLRTERDALKAEVEQWKAIAQMDNHVQCRERTQILASEVVAVMAERDQARARVAELEAENQRLISERNELRRLDTLADMREAELEAALRFVNDVAAQQTRCCLPASVGCVSCAPYRGLARIIDTALTGAPSGRREP